MWQTIKQTVLFTAAVAILIVVVSGSARAQTCATKQPGVLRLTGTLADTATYCVEVPANWNGTLFLYSHGYVEPGAANPAMDVGDPITRFFMLSSGYALAGSSYATTGSPYSIFSTKRSGLPNGPLPGDTRWAALSLPA
jgi:hypothetical protein